jgi:hypothetical protein
LIAGEIQSFESSFKGVVSVIRMVGTNGVRFVLQFWFGPVPMFWLPKGWMPGYVEWLLAFPKAPSGSISIQIWFMACTSVIAIVWEGLTAVWALRAAQPSGEKKDASSAKSTGRKEKIHVQ